MKRYHKVKAHNPTYPWLWYGDMEGRQLAVLEGTTFRVANHKKPDMAVTEDDLAYTAKHVETSDYHFHDVIGPITDWKITRVLVHEGRRFGHEVTVMSYDRMTLDLMEECVPVVLDVVTERLIARTKEAFDEKFPDTFDNLMRRRVCRIEGIEREYIDNSRGAVSYIMRAMIGVFE